MATQMQDSTPRTKAFPAMGLRREGAAASPDVAPRSRSDEPLPAHIWLGFKREHGEELREWLVADRALAWALPDRAGDEHLLAAGYRLMAAKARLNRVVSEYAVAWADQDRHAAGIVAALLRNADPTPDRAVL